MKKSLFLVVFLATIVFTSCETENTLEEIETSNLITTRSSEHNVHYRAIVSAMNRVGISYGKMTNEGKSFLREIVNSNLSEADKYAILVNNELTRTVVASIINKRDVFIEHNASEYFSQPVHLDEISRRFYIGPLAEHYEELNAYLGCITNISDECQVNFECYVIEESKCAAIHLCCNPFPIM